MNSTFTSPGKLTGAVFVFSLIATLSLHAQPFAGGDGTSGNPYQVATAVQLDSVRHYGSTANTYFIQTADINLNISAYNTGSGWLPIANFRGFYNGDGHIISGLFINRETTDNVGLFGTVSNNSSPSNLAIQKLALIAPVVTGRSQVGALVGDLSSGDVEQVGIKGGTVTVKGNYGGGIVGVLGSGGSSSLPSTARIDDNYSTARVIGPDRDGSGYGGLIGLHRERATLTGNIAAGEVSGPAESIGGLVGHMLKDLSSPLNTNFYLRNSNERDIGSRKAGIQNRSIGVGLSTNQMYQQAFYTNANGEDRLGFDGPWVMLDEGSVLPELRVFVTDFGVMYAGGSGIQADPYQIATAKQLYHVRQLPTLYFQQTADINLGVAPYDTTNNAPGWTPIEQFNGSFNGNGYTISNLRIKPATNIPDRISNLGLFAKVGERNITASLENMTLLNPFITNGDNVGALAGSIGGVRLTNIHIRGGSVVGSSSVGGLIGIGGSLLDNGMVRIITKSSAIGMRVTNNSSQSNTSSGGLFGTVYFAEIIDSYVANKVQGGSVSGGLAGELTGLPSRAITNSYSASAVDGSGSAKVGGLFAEIAGGFPSTFVPIKDSYFNHDSTSSKPASNNIYGDSLNTAQMRQRASFTNWDFTNTWFIDEGVNFPGLLESRGNYIDITGNEGWRMLASPLQSQSIGSLLAPLWTQGFTGADATNGTSNVYFYNESTPISQPWSAPTDTSEVRAPGTGFLMYVYSDDNLDGIPEGFPKRLTPTGTPVSGQVSVNLSYNNTNPEDPNLVGFNMVGNPYPTTINWDASRGWTRRSTNVNESFYVWNNAASSYEAWNGLTGSKGDGLIAPWQAFWVQVSATAGANPEIVFTDTVRNAGGVFLKQAKAVIPKIDLELEGGELSSKSVIMFHEKAERGKDPYDAYKLHSLNPENYLLLGTSTDGRQVMDIQALPVSAGQSELELIIEGSELSGEFTLNWSPAHLPEGWEAELVDTQTGESFSLADTASYTFSLNPVKAKAATKEKEESSKDIGLPASPITPVIKSKKGPSRFVIRLSLSVSNEPSEDLPQRVELLQNYPNPFNPVTTINYLTPRQSRVRLEVFDMLGRKVATLVDNEQKLAGRHSVRFEARDLASGVYLYRLQVDGKILTKRLTLIK